MKRVIIIGVILGLIGIGVVVGMNSESSSQVEEISVVEVVEISETDPSGGRNISLELEDSVVLAEQP